MPVEHRLYASKAYTGLMELRTLAYFRAVAELGSIAKAAAALNMTQPTLSRQIGQLERQLGYELLRRSSRGTLLTATGQGLYDHLSSLFEQVDRIPEVLRTVDQFERLLHVGIPSGIPTPWIEEFERALHEADPAVTLSLHEATSAEQRKLLQDGTIDIGLVRMEPTELHSRMTFTQRFGAAVRCDSPLATRSSISVDDLAGLRVMAHSSQETPAQEARLRAATVGIGVDWQLRRFSEYGETIANTGRADAVLVAEASAERHFPTWCWVPFANHATDIHTVQTWAAWADPDLEDLDVCLAAMERASRVDYVSAKASNSSRTSAGFSSGK